MKKVLLVFLGIALTFGVNAQLRYGVKIGGTLSQVIEKEKGEKSESSDPKFGFQAGGILEYSFSPSFALQPELLYVNSGGKSKVEIEGHKSTMNLHSIQLPVNLKYKMGTENLKFYVTAGPYLGYIVAAKMKQGSAKSVDLFADIEGEKSPYKHFDFGLGAGFGIEFLNNYIAGVGYNYGLANLTKEKNYKMKTGTFNLSIGYLF
jgi:opacity protein-like surface antigen